VAVERGAEIEDRPRLCAAQDDDRQLKPRGIGKLQHTQARLAALAANEHEPVETERLVAVSPLLRHACLPNPPRSLRRARAADRQRTLAADDETARDVAEQPELRSGEPPKSSSLIACGSAAKSAMMRVPFAVRRSSTPRRSVGLARFSTCPVRTRRWAIIVTK